MRPHSELVALVAGRRELLQQVREVGAPRSNSLQLLPVDGNYCDKFRGGGRSGGDRGGVELLGPAAKLGDRALHRGQGGRRLVALVLPDRDVLVELALDLGAERRADLRPEVVAGGVVERLADSISPSSITVEPEMRVTLLISSNVTTPMPGP